MPIGNDSQYHISLNDIPLNLTSEPGKPLVAGAHSSAGLEQQVQRQDVPRTWDDFSGGMGFARNFKGLPAYNYALGAYTRSPGLILPAGKLTQVFSSSTWGRIRCSAQYLRDIYFGAGGYVLKMDKTSGAVSAAYHPYSGGETVASLQQFDGLLLGGGDSNFVAQDMIKYDGASWSKPGPARDYLASVWWVVGGVGAMRLIGSIDKYHVKVLPSGGDPTNDADWTATYQVGDTSEAITGIAVSNQHAYFLKYDGVYDMDARGHSPNMTPYWGRVFDHANGAAGIWHSGYLYATHIQGLDRADVSSKQRLDDPNWCQPGAALGLPIEASPIYGPSYTLCEDSGWLVAAFYNGTSSYVCYARDKRLLGVDVPGPLIWHGAEAVIPGQVTHLRVATIGSRPYLLIGAMNGSNSVLWKMSLPVSGNPLQDFLNGGAHEFQDSFSVFFSAEAWGDPLSRKTVVEYAIESENLGQAYLELWSAADRGSYTRHVLDNESPVRSFLADADANSGYAIEHKLVGSGESDNPPIFRSLRGRASLHPRVRAYRDYSIEITEADLLRSGVRGQRDPTLIWAQVEALQGESVVDLIDETGRTFQVQVMQNMPFTKTYEKERGLVIRAVVRVAIINGPVWTWGDGTRWGDGAPWG